MTRGCLFALLLPALLLLAPAAAAAPGHVGAQMHPWGLGEGRNARDNIAELDALQSAGANTVRMDMPWAEIQPSRGAVDPAFQRRVDEFVAAANTRGIDPIMNLTSTPCWASSDPRAVRCAGHADRYHGFQHVPADLRALGEISAYLARRYTTGGFRLAAFELWNEPNWCFLQLAGDRAGCPPPAGVDPASERKAAAYAAMVRESYGPIKDAAPSLPVLVGALGDQRPIRFLRALYRHGIYGHYDAISIHPYRDVARVIEAARRTVVAREPRFFKSPLWVTEVGRSTCRADIRTRDYCATQAQQAAFIERTLGQIASAWPWIEGVSVYEIRDSAVGDPVQAGFGLLEASFSAKPAFEAVARAFRARQPRLVELPAW